MTKEEKIRFAISVLDEKIRMKSWDESQYFVPRSYSFIGCSEEIIMEGATYTNGKLEGYEEFSTYNGFNEYTIIEGKTIQWEYYVDHDTLPPLDKVLAEEAKAMYPLIRKNHKEDLKKHIIQEIQYLKEDIKSTEKRISTLESYLGLED